MQIMFIMLKITKKRQKNLINKCLNKKKKAKTK